MDVPRQTPGTTAVHARSELCRDCQACALACSLYHEGQCHLGLARLRIDKDMARYTFAIHICRHCPEPACLAACPTDAMSLDERGVVLIDEAACTRCGGCAASCPHEAIFYCEREDRYVKCDLCMGREEGPLCTVLCPVGALRRGEEGGGGV